MSYQPLDIDLSGHVALVTGANSGMGKATARELGRMGAEVILGCRSRQRGEAARNEITESIGGAALTVMEVDLASLASVRSLPLRSPTASRSWTCSLTTRPLPCRNARSHPKASSAIGRPTCSDPTY